MMKSLSDLAIRIGADFVGLPAFKKADTAVDKLYKGTKKLAGALGVAFSATAITRYSASAVRAFAAEEKQIAALTTTVKNLGLAFTAPEMNKFIENLERMTGITREELQPAFQKLLTQTGSIAKSQEILATAVEVSFSGLMSTSEAADILTKAYVGNTKGLRQLNLGLTTAQLNQMTFDQILQKVSKTYKDQYAAALETTAVKLDKLSVASGNAKENIGSGLVDAFSNLVGNGDLDKANKKLEDMSNNIADVLRSVTSTGWLDFIRFLSPFDTGGFKNPKVSTVKGFGGDYFTVKAQQNVIAKKEAEALKKLKKQEADRLAILKKQRAEKALAAAIDKANALLNKSKDIFDLEKISIDAAMKNESLTENERKRLEIKQAILNLEDAIASKDISKIDAASKTLNTLTGQFAVLQSQDSLLAKINSAYDALGMNKDLININNLDVALAKLQQMNLLLNGTKTPTPSSSLNAPSGGGITATSTWDPASLRWRDEGNTGNQPTLPSSIGATWDPAAVRRGEMGQPPIIIKVEGKANDLVNFIYDTVTDQSASGNPPIVTRIGQNLAW